MKKIKVSDEEVEFLEEKDLESLLDKVLQIGTKKGIPDKVIKKAKKNLLKETKKAKKNIDREKPDLSQLRRLRQSTKHLEEMARNPSSYSPEAMKEILKSL